VAFRLQESIAGIEARGGPFRQALIARLAPCYSMMGRNDEAVRILDEALAHVERTGEKFWQAEMLRVKGEVLLVHRRTATASAEACFRAALEVARARSQMVGVTCIRKPRAAAARCRSP